ncbi:low affinity immunoglobulin gamma Fc region receptor III-A isoform X4 [Lates calcarifer]|uniref:low affinity immunoglobulin gamma Fc region receptor III-A isoform X2 n=1 Tax=Lates calcarifer TaxID=8187 RepID=UPI0021D7B51B|nr:low affinity immunoglobulin gamma Fc region receptor III-A isoform X2 [Lates calcarifer]XP_050924490.1 low affinity immunoglobulin gamma Fc region receptor III-A isoform X3 [Lates calcarifer]XP_050924491.1 low affinity immunoglobulin gamma Fc region receptor III-A isoform X4 [Lates calcarifer]
MEVTALCFRLMVNVLLLLTAQAQKSDRVFLRIEPNSQQFFDYEPISLKCEGTHSPAEWKVMRRITSDITECESSTGSLDIPAAFVSHSGEYWCENAEGERSNTVNISVTGDGVILESPALPVTEGDAVTLRCRRKGSSSDLPADFYKNGLISGTGYTGQITIPSVSKSDEGLYKCSISGSNGESPESWLAVTAANTTPSTPQERQTHPSQESPPNHLGLNQLSIQLSVVFTILCVAVLLLVMGLLHCRKQRVACFSSEMPRGGSDPAVADPHMATYANVTNDTRRRGCQEENVSDPNNVTYAVVNTKRKERVSREADVCDSVKATYALVQRT